MLLLGLYREMYRFSVAEGVRYWYAAMERSLARALTKMGMPFDQIGPTAEYYGKVAPYMLDLSALAAAMPSNNAQLASWFNEPPVLTVQHSVRPSSAVAA